MRACVDCSLGSGVAASEVLTVCSLGSGIAMSQVLTVAWFAIWRVRSLHWFRVAVSEVFTVRWFRVAVSEAVLIVAWFGCCRVRGVDCTLVYCSCVRGVGLVRELPCHKC